ncbi:hypothetical protein Ddye_009642 [Dipteronia dyeriana]|uniref:Reverse transcriptase domain-containing protein n=1 Tax=Dipteronia dyeriana TaxID=168575 RepID=A0AAE0CME7_9ROSI|nr:hypothetical protein Ddye_009642 [Dipteronia dyeriana]
MSKVYDRVEWDFLAKIMDRLGFSVSWIGRIMNYVKYVSFSFLNNGQITDLIIPTKGIRQGDPLSPYLYLLAAEVLSSLLESAVQRKEYIWFKCGCSSPSIRIFSLLTMSLFKASSRDFMNITNIFDWYSRASG